MLSHVAEREGGKKNCVFVFLSVRLRLIFKPHKAHRRRATNVSEYHHRVCSFTFTPLHPTLEHIVFKMGESDNFLMLMDFISPDDLMFNDNTMINHELALPDFNSPSMILHPVHTYEEYEDETRIYEERKKRKNHQNSNTPTSPRKAPLSPRALQVLSTQQQQQPYTFLDFYHTFFFTLLLVDLVILAFETFYHGGRQPFILSTIHTVHFFVLSLMWFVVGTLIMFSYWTFVESKKQKPSSLSTSSATT